MLLDAQPVASLWFEQPGGFHSARGEPRLIILSLVELAPTREAHLALLLQVGRSLIVLLIIQMRDLLMLHHQVLLMRTTDLPRMLSVLVHTPPLLAREAVSACPLAALLTFIEVCCSTFTMPPCFLPFNIIVKFQIYTDE